MTVYECPQCGAYADPFNRDGAWRYSATTALVEHVHNGIRYVCRAVPAVREDEVARLREAGDALAQAVIDRWTGEGACDCACCAGARAWQAVRGEPVTCP